MKFIFNFSIEFLKFSVKMKIKNPENFYEIKGFKSGNFCKKQGF